MATTDQGGRAGGPTAEGAAWAITLGTLIPALDMGLVAVSLPAIARHFQADTDAVSWVLLAYLLVQGSFLLFFVRLGERQGVKKAYLAGLVVFVAGALLSLLAPRLTDLVVGRLIQGIGASMLLSPLLVSTYLPRSLSRHALGRHAAAGAAGLALGLALGGMIADFAGWRYVFLPTVPVAIGALVLGSLVLARHGAVGDSGAKDTVEPVGRAAADESGPGSGSIAVRTLENDTSDDSPKEPPPFRSWTGQSYDGWGAFLLFMLSVSLVFVIQQGQSLGWTSSPVLIGVGAVILFGYGFLRRERRHPDPLFDLRALRGRGFVDSALAYMLLAAAGAGILFVFPFYFEYALGAAPWLSGLLLAVYAAAQAPAAWRGHLREAGGTGAARRLCLLAAFLMTGAFVIAALFLLPTPEPFAVAAAVAVAVLVTAGVSLGTFTPAVRRLQFRGGVAGGSRVADGFLRTFFGLGLALGVVSFETATRLTAIHLGRGPAPSYRLSPDLFAEAARSAFAVGMALCLLAGVILVMLKKDEQHQE